MPRNEYEGLWEHPDWATYKHIESQELGRQHQNISEINSCVAQLQFIETGDGKQFTGNAFFLKVPELENSHIILTAAKHLIVNGSRTINVKVVYNAKDQQGNLSIIERNVDNRYISSQVRIFDVYCSNGVASPGYAAIILPRARHEVLRGFGFSLKLTPRKTFGDFIYLSRFENYDPTPLLPDTYLVPNVTYLNKKVALSYRISSEEWSSGCPIWIEYKGFPTVVAMHMADGAVSTGDLVTADMYREVFEWLSCADILRKNIRIQIFPNDLMATAYHTGDRGIFLSFMSGTGFARARLDAGSSFDWMLAEVGSGETYYVLSPVGERKWVLFDVEAEKYQGVQLTEDLTSPGIFLQNVAGKDQSWAILVANTVTSRNKALKLQLRIEGTRLKVYDSSRESSEVSLVRVGSTEAHMLFHRFSMTITPDTSQDGLDVEISDQCLDGSDDV